MALSDPEILLAYESPEGRRAVRASAVVEYRCANRRACLLLHVWRSPRGLLFYRPAYKLSPTRNAAESSDAGRAANTTDGLNHWQANAGSLDAARGWEGHLLSLQCDHVQEHVETARIIEDADKATPGRPRRRRFPVNDW